MRLSRAQLIFIFLLCSLLIHLCFFYLLTQINITPHRQIENKPEVVFVDLPQNKLPIVSITKPLVEKAPEKPSAQSIYNSSVPQEQVTQRQKPDQKSSQTQTKQSKSSSKSDLQKPSKKVDQPKKPLNNPKKLPPVNAKQQQTEVIQKNESSRGGDYLPKIKIGDTTYLNTEANPNIGYFVELKRRFSLTWNPAPILRAQMSRLPPGKIRVQLGVTVDAKGSLIKVVVLTPSGIYGYDEESMRAVKSSAPFSSPPLHFLENGLLHMSWGFVVNR